MENSDEAGRLVRWNLPVIFAEGNRVLQGRSHGLRHPGGFVPGPTRRGCRNDGKPTGKPRFDLVMPRGQPTGRRTTVNDTASTTRSDAEETRSEIDRIAIAESENVEL